MEKNTGEIPVIFRLIDENGDDVTDPISKNDKVGNCYYFFFDSVASVGEFDLEISIKDGDNIVRANDEDQVKALDQACTTYSPWATFGPRKLFFFPLNAKFHPFSSLA